MSKKKIDRIKFSVSNETTKESEISIDVPTFFKVDAQRLYDVIMKDLIKQEKGK